MTLIKKSEVKQALGSLEGWSFKGKALEKEYRFKEYLDGIRFVNKVARLAERENHHPDIGIVWTSVRLGLTTHDEGGITERDLRMAKKINGLRS